MNMDMLSSRTISLREWLFKPNGSPSDVIVIDSVVYTRRELLRRLEVIDTVETNIHKVG